LILQGSLLTQRHRKHSAMDSNYTTTHKDDYYEPLDVLRTSERFLYEADNKWKPLDPFSICTRLAHFPDPDHTFQTYAVRRLIAKDISSEVLRSTKLIFLCFHCEKYIVGKVCYSHHIDHCLDDDLFTKKPWELWIPTFWKWTNCGHCFRQEVLAERYDAIPSVSSPLHWARLTRSLIERKQGLAAWLNIAPLKRSTVPLAYEVSLFVA